MFSVFPTQFEIARSSEIHLNFVVHMCVTCTYSEISSEQNATGVPALLASWERNIAQR